MERLERLHEFAIYAACALVHDHQVRRKAEHRLLQHGRAYLRDFVGPRRHESRLIVIGCHPIKAWELDVVETFGNSKIVDHRRTGHDENGGIGTLLLEGAGERQRSADVAEPESVVRVEEDLAALVMTAFVDSQPGCSRCSACLCFEPVCVRLAVVPKLRRGANRIVCV